MLTVVTATMTCSLYLTCIFPQECTKSSFLFFRITKAHPFSKDTQRTFFASVETLTQGFMKAKQALYRQLLVFKLRDLDGPYPLPHLPTATAPHMCSRPTSCGSVVTVTVPCSARKSQSHRH